MINEIKYFIILLMLMISTCVESKEINNFTSNLNYDLREEVGAPRKISLRYKLLKDGLEIVIGPFSISSASFNAKIVFDSNSEFDHIEASWPKDIFFPEQVIIKNEHDITLFTAKLNSQIMNNTSRMFSLSDADKKKQFPKIYRVCVKQTELNFYTEICSPLASGKTHVSPRVIINGAKSQSEGDIEIESGGALNFFAELRDGLRVSQVITPSTFGIVELSDISSGGKLRLIGTGKKPLSAVVVKDSLIRKEWLDNAGLKEEQALSQKFWSLILLRGAYWVDIPTSSGGSLRYYFDVPSELPSDKLKLTLHKTTPFDSYRSDPKLKGVSKSKIVITSGQNSVSMLEDGQSFNWIYKNDEIGFYNRSYLLVTDSDKKTYRAFYDMYRGFGNEFSTRMSGLVIGSGYSFVGELMYNHWFEDIFGWRNVPLSIQRWGINFKYLNSLSPITLPSTQTVNFSSTTFDLKYRFKPGVFLHGETMGAMLSYQSISLGTLSAPMAGAGWFWARGLPQFLEPVFNWVKYFRYPKYVDMEIIYYPTSLDSAYKVSSAYSVNFHGQILWTPSIFGEAGFGYRSCSLQNSTSQGDVSNMYGTLGLGMRF